MKNFTFLILVIVLFTSCSTNQNLSDKSVLIKTDSLFSELCLEKGTREAFLAYADTTAVMLSDNMFPAVGKQTIKILEGIKYDSLLVFSWTPLDADIAQSGEIGYTYGIYTRHYPDTIYKGSYATIWKKNKNGEWKFVLDVGTDGL